MRCSILWRLFLLSMVALCTSGFRCGPLVQNCLKDGDCGFRERCTFFRCTELPDGACDSNADCVQASFCERGQCVARPECTKDEHCQAPLVCRSRTCTPPPRPDCIADKDCTNGQICAASVCVPPAQCLKDADCQADQRCAQNICVARPTCKNAADCSPVEYCNAGLCEAKPPCLAHHDCPLGFECVQKACVKDPVCRTDQDCKAPLLCDQGRCVPSCQSDSDCSRGLTCQQRMCKTPRPCSDDRDCNNNRTCQNKACLPCTSTREICDGSDNDCNGKIDDLAPLSCYTGPAHTASVGACKYGFQRCIQGKWGPCTEQVLPQTEKCGDQIDNNCDGQTDEDCNAGSQDLWQWCDATKRCKKGLQCHAGLCHKRCNKNKNPPNSDCPNPRIERCEVALHGQGYYVCKRVCDRGGGFEHPNCPVGTYCEDAKVLRCLPTTPPAYGPQTLGQPCKHRSTPPGLQCNGNKGLACHSGICRQVCDPRKGDQDCPTGKLCSNSTESYKGGFCL